MKQIITLIGLVAISVLYLFEVDYSAVTTMNLVAFAIIAATLIYIIVAIVLTNERRKQKKAQKLQDQQPREIQPPPV